MRTVQDIDEEISRLKRNSNIKIMLLWCFVFAIWYGLYVAAQP